MNKFLKKFQLTAIILILVQLVCSVILFLTYFLLKQTSTTYELLFLISIVIATLFNTVIFAYFILFMNKKSKMRFMNEIKGADIIGSDFQEAYNDGGIGLVVTDDNDTILWINEFMQNNSFHFFDEKIDDFNPELTKLRASKDPSLSKVVEYENHKYRVKLIKEANLYIFKDITTEDFNLKVAADNMPVVGYVTFDNYYDAQQLSTDEKNFSAEIFTLKNMIQTYFSDKKALCREIRYDTFIVVTSKGYFDQLTVDKFSIVDKIRDKSTLNLTISIAMSYGGIDYLKLSELALNGLDVALSRGGDQVVITPLTEPIYYFGGKTEAKVSHNKVKMRVKADSLITLIKNSEKIYVFGHDNADLDAVGAAFGIIAMSAAVKREAYYVYDEMHVEKVAKNAIRSELLAKNRNDLFISYREFSENYTSRDLVVIVDCNSPKMVYNSHVIPSSAAVAIVDHHRPTGGSTFDNVVYSGSDVAASSASEIVTQFINSSSTKIPLDSQIATFLLAGLTMDTNHFRNKTSAYTFDTAAILKSAGADSEIVDEFLKENMEEYLLKNNIMASALALPQGVLIVSAKDKSQLLTSTAIAIFASEGLNIKGVRISFCIGKMANGKVKISARSDGSVNCQYLLEKMHGGGHYTMAATELENSSVQEAEDLLKGVLDEYLLFATTKQSDAKKDY